MNRRNLILSTALAIPAVAFSSGIFVLRGGEDIQNLTIEVALRKLQQLPVGQIQSTGVWNLAQVFTHCAQSIEFSMRGFPQHKSNTFKNTIGATAFVTFSAAGKMKHGLDEPIPGAPSLANENNLLDSIQKLSQAFVEFDNFNGQVAPHFAYGMLTKSEYEIAHVLHFYNHLEEVDIGVEKA